MKCGQAKSASLINAATTYVQLPRTPQASACQEKETIKAVQTRCAELADYKRVRKVVVYKDPLERTSVGKVRRVVYKGKLDE